jgi:membrane protein DedA with SNARE-associated domain
MFVAMLIEGPTITTVGAFLARVGYFTVSMVFLISILGNFIPDVGYYALGRWGRGFIDRHPLLFSKLRITKENIARGERLFKNHSFIALLVSKLVPILGLSGLIGAGVVKMPLKKYALYSLIIILITSGAFLGIGYFFGTGYYLGKTYISFAYYQEFALAAIGAAILLTVWSYAKLKVWWGNKLVSTEELK